MRLEGGDDYRPALVETHRDRAADHRLVAEVEAVEIAERDHAPAKAVRQGLAVRQALHRSGV